MITEDEFGRTDDAAMQDEYRKALQSIAEGDAPSLALRTMALRALRGIVVRADDLITIKPTSSELAKLDAMHDQAARR
jgi:hypothetical protein